MEARFELQPLPSMSVTPALNNTPSPDPGVGGVAQNALGSIQAQFEVDSKSDHRPINGKNITPQIKDVIDKLANNVAKDLAEIKEQSNWRQTLNSIAAFSLLVVGAIAAIVGFFILAVFLAVTVEIWLPLGLVGLSFFVVGLFLLQDRHDKNKEIAEPYDTKHADFEKIWKDSSYLNFVKDLNDNKLQHDYIFVERGKIEFGKGYNARVEKIKQNPGDNSFHSGKNANKRELILSKMWSDLDFYKVWSAKEEAAKKVAAAVGQASPDDLRGLDVCEQQFNLYLEKKYNLFQIPKQTPNPNLDPAQKKAEDDAKAAAAAKAEAEAKAKLQPQPANPAPVTPATPQQPQPLQPPAGGAQPVNPQSQPAVLPGSNPQQLAAGAAAQGQPGAVPSPAVTPQQPQPLQSPSSPAVAQPVNLGAAAQGQPVVPSPAVTPQQPPLQPLPSQPVAPGAAAQATPVTPGLTPDPEFATSVASASLEPVRVENKRRAANPPVAQTNITFDPNIPQKTKEYLITSFKVVVGITEWKLQKDLNGKDEYVSNVLTPTQRSDAYNSAFHLHNYIGKDHKFHLNKEAYDKSATSPDIL